MKQDGVTLNMLKQLENPGERFLPLAPPAAAGRAHILKCQQAAEIVPA